jgi:NADH-quinone oxidoreductase subunit C
VTEPAAPETPTVEVDPVIAKLREHFEGRLLEVPETADHPTFVVDRADLIDVLAFLRDDPDLAFARLSDVTAVDYLSLGRVPRFAVVYHVYSLVSNRYARVRVPVDEDDASVPSITGMWPGANFFEREVFDMFGIVFQNHPNLTRILNPDDWIAYPLRKDFQPPPEPIEFSINPDQWQKAVQRGHE